MLKDGETLSNFVDESFRSKIHHRKAQQEFIARGMASRESAKKTGKYFTAEESLVALDAILEKHKPQ